MENPRINFRGWDCRIKVGRYPATDQIYIQLVDADDGSPVATASVAVGEVSIDPDKVIIKNWSENEGIADALIDAGVIGEPITEIPTGFVTASVHKLIDYDKYGI